MAELQRDHEDARTATSTGPHVDRGRVGADPSGPDTGADATATGRLLRDDERGDLRERWDALQGRFVDDPTGVARLADELLRDTRERVTRRWEERHGELTRGWEERDDATTEDLRTTLRRYRDLFERLLAS